MSVNLRRFVNVNITRAKRNAVNPVRDTVALFNATELSSDKIFIGYQKITENDTEKYAFYVQDETEPIVVATNSNFGHYGKMFFDNGGVKLHAYNAIPSVTSGKLVVGNITVPDTEIACACVSGLTALGNVIATYNAALNPNNPQVEGMSKKNIMTSAAKLFFGNTLTSNATAAEENIGYKYGEPGIEMSILAYLSKVNVYGENTVNDYNFTIERINDMSVEEAISQTTEKDVYTSDSLVGTCMKYNINIDTVLSGQIRNVGGNLMSGADLVNAYALIVLQQTVEEKVVNALGDKLSGAEGTASIYNAIVSELNKYNRCGLLAAGNWHDEDWVITFNERDYVVASANERFVLGYKILVVPFAALTSDQVAAHECPPIYIALTTSYGIRKVIINGEVL